MCQHMILVTQMLQWKLHETFKSLQAGRDPMSVNLFVASFVGIGSNERIQFIHDFISCIYISLFFRKVFENSTLNSGIQLHQNWASVWKPQNGCICKQ